MQTSFKAFFIAAFFLCFSLPFNFANNIDSLKSVLPNLPEDTSKVNVLLDLSSQLWRSVPDEAIVYAEEAVELSEKKKYSKGSALALKNIGLAYYIKGDYVSVLNYWQQALEAYRKNNDKVGVGNILSNIGAVYFNQGDNPKALEFYLESLRVSEETGNKLRIATALSNIGAVYSNEESTYEKAKEYFIRAIEVSEEAGDVEAIGTSSVNLGEIYMVQGDHQSALKYFGKALEALKESGGNESFVLTNIGKSFHKQGDFVNALKFQNQAFEKAKEKNNKLEMANALVALGETYFSKKEFNKALSSFEQAENIGEEINSNKIFKEAYAGLAKSYAAKNNYENAYQYQGLLGAVKDSIFNDENKQKMAGLQFQFEIEKKEAEIELLNRDNELQASQIERAKILRNFLIAVAALMLVIIGGVTYSYRYAQKTNKIITEERNRSEKLLLNILPAETANELKERGAVKAKKYEFVTVLFTDFKAFTKQVENIPPEELVESIDFYFRAFDEIFQNYHLEKIKTIGDSYMCAGGLPSSNLSNPEDAIKAGLKIVSFVEGLKKSKPDNIHLFDVRVGISTGPVIAGVVGTTKFQYDIWGDTVNVASRMETASEIGKVNISEFTYAYVKDKFEFSFRGNIKVKNRGEIGMYYVERALS
jgi:class 3 adenylate cyclase/Tfp pilus assembly protein PilF